MFQHITVPMILTNPDIYDADGHTVPYYATQGSVAVDLRANSADDIVLQPNECKLIGTGIRLDMSKHECLMPSNLPDADGEFNTMYSFQLPDGLALCCTVLPRSGKGHKEGIICGNVIGLIDEDYQGEIQVSTWNRSSSVRTIEAGERFAQLLFLLAVRPTFTVVEEFESKTSRGEGGFGHSGS